jgi:hypothetical protein
VFCGVPQASVLVFCGVPQASVLVFCGVPQASVLSFLVFNIFVHNIIAM